MEPKTLATSILVKDLEKYLALDHNGEKLMEAFCLNHPSNRPAIVPVKEEEEETLLKTRSQLEITLLTWLSVVSPTYKQNYGIRGENLELVYKIDNDEIHADIEDGVYYFTKDHFYNRDQKAAESLDFAIQDMNTIKALPMNLKCKPQSVLKYLKIQIHKKLLGKLNKVFLIRPL